MEFGKERKGRKLPVVLNFEEFNKLLSSTKNPRHRLAFKLGFLCGLRVSEVVKLQLEDVDLGRRMLFIRQSKNHKDRYVPFPEQFSRDLKNLPVNKGIRALQKAVKASSIKAGIAKDVHFHTLRHSCATFYLGKGMNLVQVQQMLGHSQIGTTMIYLHVSPDNVKNTMDEIWR
jgi:integrase/recombinase XerD